ncbi:hypothetical protein ACSU1N_01390 [Thermogladius sp. 4427co]|uniref:hypothetical protein n=1 Tax=Thermogladius sp. 4427co TaxID=3450718 RepID=UPI003F79B53B
MEMYVIILVSGNCERLDEIVYDGKDDIVVFYTPKNESYIRGIARKYAGRFTFVKVGRADEENFLKLYVKYPPMKVYNCDCSNYFGKYIELLKSATIEMVDYCIG